MKLYLLLITYFEEYSFGYTNDDSSGVYTITPCSNSDYVYRCSIDMGFLSCDLKQLEAIVENLKKEYSGKSYHILHRYLIYFNFDLITTN